MQTEDLRRANEDEFDARVTEAFARRAQWTRLQMFAGTLAFTVVLMLILQPQTFVERSIALVLSAFVSILLLAINIEQKKDKPHA